MHGFNNLHMIPFMTLQFLYVQSYIQPPMRSHLNRLNTSFGMTLETASYSLVLFLPVVFSGSIRKTAASSTQSL